MKRAFNPEEPELMDRPQPVTPELEADLANLVSLNRYFGSHRLVRHFLKRWFRAGEVYRVLDLATGAGDVPRVIADWARGRGVTVRIDAVDANPSTLAIARGLSREYPEIEFSEGDVLNFTPAHSYDLVCCSLALHHFSAEDAVKLLRFCGETSARFVIVADLERSLATLAGVYALTTLIYREPMTRSDACVSARRAFSFAEFRELAETAGWRDYGHARFLFCRQALWLERQQPGDIPETVALEDGMPCPVA